MTVFFGDFVAGIVPLNFCLKYLQANSVVSTEEDKIRLFLKRLNIDFLKQEKVKAFAGYHVKIETFPSFKASIIPCGIERKMSEPLSGMPKDESAYIKTCCFCEYAVKISPDPRIMQKFKNGSLSVTSLSNQVLVIPEKHYPHWFTIPLETQVKLFQNMLALRKAHSSEIKGPIEFHCGAAGGQTVFHFHGRTGVYIARNLHAT